MTQPKERKQKTVSTRGDQDPEDEYNNLDNPVVSSRKGPRYDKHLGGELVGKSSARHQSALLEDAFKEGKYEGRVVSRRDLGLVADNGGDLSDVGDGDEYISDGDESDESDMSDMSACEYESDGKEDEMDQFVQEMNELKRQEAKGIKLIQRQRVSDKTRGEHVRNQMSAWEGLLEVEMRIHPLLELVNRRGAVCGKRLLREINEIGRTLQSFASKCEWTEERVWVEGREQLAKWHQQAIATSMTSVNKQGLATLARDPWTFVEDAWRTDRDRLLKKARRLAPTDGDAATTVSQYDDTDFHRHLLKEWTQFRSTDGVAFLATHLNNKHKPTEGRVSKGRRLCHDAHPKLLAYMMPVVDGTRQWSDEKVDDLIKSLFRS